MGLQTFDQAAGVPLSSIRPDVSLAWDSSGTLADLQTNGSGQLEAASDNRTIGVTYPSGVGPGIVYYNANYAGTSAQYVGPLARSGPSNQGYRVTPNTIVGGNVTVVRIVKDGVFFDAPTLNTPMPLATGGLSVDHTGGNIVITVYDGSTLIDTVSVADASPPAGTLYGFIVARAFGVAAVDVQLEAFDDGGDAGFGPLTIQDYAGGLTVPDGSIEYRVTAQADDAEIIAWTSTTVSGNGFPRVTSAALTSGQHCWLELRRGAIPDWTGGSAKAPFTAN